MGDEEPHWVQHLPAQERALMHQELRACAWTGDDPDVVLAAWKSTAEVYADPELLEALTRPLDDGDFGEVHRPES